MKRTGKGTLYVALLFMIALALGLNGCGDDTPTGGTTTTTTAPPPAATIQVSGNGNIAVGASIDPTFCCSILFPIKIVETSGGTAIWNFFRVSYFLNGQEVERSEVGSNTIRQAGRRDIFANSTSEVDVLVRSNVQNFDDVDIILGFADTNNGRAIELALDITSFDGVVLNPVPAVIPEGETAVIVGTSRE